MDNEIRKHHCYIGDGVYAEFDGYGIWLRTGNHQQDHLCDDKIYMEPGVMHSLNLFIESLKFNNIEKEENNE